LDLSPGFHQALKGRGYAELALGRNNEALGTFERAI